MVAYAFGKPSLVVVFAVTISASPALAQHEGRQPPRPSTPVVEVTPFVSMGSFDSSRVGTAINFPVTPNFSVETEVGYRRGEGDINALSASANLLYTLPRIGRVAPYLAAGAGLEEYGEPFMQPGSPEIFTRPRLAFSVNAGGGLKIPVDENWGLRADARWFRRTGTFGSEHWRIYQGASVGIGKRASSSSERR